MRPRALLFLFVLLVASGFSHMPRARAHGLFGHVHVTGWAIENLPPGELRTMFEDPDVVAAALMGATFPDTGYALGSAASAAYAEHAHWEPFIEDLVQHVITTYGPTYETKEERMLIAFLLGCASHGMQDELFDSTFLHEIEQRDQVGQDYSDPGTDGFLNYDLHTRLYPSDDYLPIAELLPLFDELGQEITAELILEKVNIVLSVYVNDGFGRDTSIAIGEMYRPLMPWTVDHYLDPAVPGSLRAEIEPTRAYMLALWERVHGRFDEADLVIHAWPDAPRRLREADHTSVGSWVTVVFGKGVRFDSLSSSLEDSAGAPHPFTLANTRWNSQYTRLVRFRASADYVPGGHYVAGLAEGATLIDGSVTTQPHEVAFQVECASASDAACPPLGELDDPDIYPPGVPPTPVAPGGRLEGGSCAVVVATPDSRGGLLAIAGLLLALRTRRRQNAMRAPV